MEAKDNDRPHQMSIWITIGDRNALMEMSSKDDRSMSSLVRKIIRREIETYQKGKHS